MTKPPSLNWDPEQELMALLDALTDELLNGADYRTASLLSKGEASAVAAEIRKIAAAADMDLFMPSGPEVPDRDKPRPISLN